MEELKEELKQSSTGDTRLSKEEMKEKIKDIKENHLQIETTSIEPEQKKRGRKKYEDMTEHEKAEYDKKKKEKEEEKERIKKLEDLGMKPPSDKDISNSLSITLTDEFIKKCKKEKVDTEQYADIIFLLMDAFCKDKIRITGKATVKYSLED